MQLEAAWQWIGSNSAAIQTVCIVLAAVAAFVVIWFTGKVSRRESTISLIRDTFLNEADGGTYNKFSNLVRQYQSENKDFSALAQQNDQNKTDKLIVKNQANEYELISLGIRKGVLDEDFYKMWFFSQFMRDYTIIKPYLDAVRALTNNDAFFCEFERMHQKWGRKKHPIAFPSRIKKIWWAASAQDHKLKK